MMPRERHITLSRYARMLRQDALLRLIIFIFAATTPLPLRHYCLPLKSCRDIVEQEEVTAVSYESAIRLRAR